MRPPSRMVPPFQRRPSDPHQVTPMRILPLILGLATILAGCATPTNDESAPTAATASTTLTPAPTEPAATPNLVHSSQKGDAYGGNVFEPQTLTIKPGETVTWDVVGEGHHTVDFLDPIDAAGAMPKSGDLGPGQTFEVTFAEAGSYKYYCKYHSNKQTGMIGTIVVE